MYVSVYLYVCMLCTISITVAVCRPPSLTYSLLGRVCVYVHIYGLSLVGCCTDIYIKDIHCTLYMMILHSFHISLKFHSVHRLFYFSKNKEENVDRIFLQKKNIIFFHPNRMPPCVRRMMMMQYKNYKQIKGQIQHSNFKNIQSESDTGVFLPYIHANIK